jgi:hypothetical protein
MKRTALLGIALLTALGCGKSKEDAIQPVSGEVVYDGKPAAGVQVFFMPESGVTAAGAKANPRAITGPDGRFTLTTVSEGDGAPAGNYRVVLLWPGEKASPDDEDAPDRLLGWYDARHTKLTAKVEPSGSSLAQFKLARVNGPPPVSEGIPGRN